MSTIVDMAEAPTEVVMLGDTDLHTKVTSDQENNNSVTEPVIELKTKVTANQENHDRVTETVTENSVTNDQEEDRLTEPISTNSVINDQENDDRVCLTFKPGRIGIEYRENVVITVHQGTQAEELGVCIGWRIEAVNSVLQSNDTNAIRDAILSTRDHDKSTDILFYKDPSTSVSKLGADRPVVSCTPEERQKIQRRLTEHRQFAHENLEHFMNKDNWKTVVITKKGEEKLGMYIKPTSPHAVVPGAVIHRLTLLGNAHQTNKLKIGDQIVRVNGTSIIGMKFSEIHNLVKSVSGACRIALEVVDGKGSLMASQSQNPNPEIDQLLKNVEIFSNPDNFIKIVMKKKAHEPLGMTISPTLADAAIPGVFISGFDRQKGVAHASGKFQIGDQIIKVNGQSTVGMSYQDSLDLLKGCAVGGEVELDVVRSKVVSTHTLTTSSPKISISCGRIFAVDPSGEGYQAGLRAHMYIMEIDEVIYYGKTDDEILKCLHEECTKEIACMSHIHDTKKPRMSFMCSEQFHDGQNKKPHGREVIFQPGLQGVCWRGRQVNTIRPESQAEKLGVQVGWRAFYVNGIKVDKGVVVGDRIIALRDKSPNNPIRIFFQESIAIEELQEEISIALEEMITGIGKDKTEQIYNAIKQNDPSAYDQWNNNNRVSDQIAQLKEFHREYLQLEQQQHQQEQVSKQGDGMKEEIEEEEEQQHQQREQRQQKQQDQKEVQQKRQQRHQKQSFIQ